jgi:hypothetical protein
MTFIISVLTTIALMNGAAAAEPTAASGAECDVAESLIATESDLTHAMNELKERHRDLRRSPVPTARVTPIRRGWRRRFGHGCRV